MSPVSTTIGGIDVLRFAALNLGPDSTMIQVRYRLLSTSKNYYCPTVVESMNSQYPYLHCYISSGVGTALSLEVVLNNVNATGQDTFSYPAPIIVSGSLRILGQRCLSRTRCFRINIDAAGLSRVIGRTTALGSDVVEFDALNLGPNLNDIAVHYGTCPSPCERNLFLPKYECVVNKGASNMINHTRVQCFTAAGIGVGHYFIVAVGGQSSLGVDTFNYPSPTICSGSLRIVTDLTGLPSPFFNPINMAPSYVLGSTTLGGYDMVELQGRNFGPESSDLIITYGPPMSPDKYLCLVIMDSTSSFNHTFARCYLSAGAGSGLVFVVGVTSGQKSDVSVDVLNYPLPTIRSCSLISGNEQKNSFVSSDCNVGYNVNGTSTLGGDLLQVFGNFFGPEPSEIFVVLSREFSPYTFAASVLKNGTSQTSILLQTGPGKGRFLSLFITVSGQQATISSDYFNYPLNRSIAANSIQAASMSLHARNISIATAGVAKFFLLQPQDKYSIPSEVASWSVNAVSAEAVGVSFVFDNFDGSYTIKLIVTRSAYYVMKVQLSPLEQNIANSPFILRVIPETKIDAGECTALSLDGTMLRAGIKASFVLQPRDSFGNDVGHADDLFFVDILGMRNMSGVVLNVGAMTQLELNLTISGKYSIHIYYNGSASNLNPFYVFVLASTAIGSKISSRKCLVNGIY
jgi:hypothetical protein